MLERSLASVVLVLAAAAAPAQASDGVIEISQACVATGCVTGDTPGFPITISQSGSYRLTSRLSLTTAETAIEVGADDVAIDLGGFVIASTNLCSGPPAVDATCTVIDTSADGIRSSAQRTRVSNGSVVGMGGSGVQLGGQAEVDRVSVANNGGRGIEITSGRVTDCSTFSNNDYGIYILSGPALIDRSNASRNGYTGMLVYNGVISHSQSGENYGAGFVIQGTGSLAVGNVSYSNLGYGITTTSGSGYAHNAINANNGGNGNTQVAGGNNLGGNVCGADTTCP